MSILTFLYEKLPLTWLLCSVIFNHSGEPIQWNLDAFCDVSDCHFQKKLFKEDH